MKNTWNPNLWSFFTSGSCCCLNSPAPNFLTETTVLPLFRLHFRSTSTVEASSFTEPLSWISSLNFHRRRGVSGLLLLPLGVFPPMSLRNFTPAAKLFVFLRGGFVDFCKRSSPGNVTAGSSALSPVIFIFDSQIQPLLISLTLSNSDDCAGKRLCDLCRVYIKLV